MAKMTKSEMFARIASHLTDVEEIAFINHEIDLLANKAERAKNASRKPSKVQVANEGLKAEMLDYIASVGSVVIKDIASKFDISSQKATPLLNALVDEGKLIKAVEKRVAHYSIG